MPDSASTVVALARDLGLDSVETTLTALREVYDRVDRSVAQGAAGLGLPCRSGCDACCREAVFVSAPEFLAVARYLIENESRPRRQAIVDAMMRWFDAFEDELLLLETITPGPERDEVAMRVRFECPLLRDGRCTVYPVRELNARTFGLTRDEDRNAPFGCGLTHERLRVLPSAAQDKLAGAREARRWLNERVPGATDVHVYPWWFARYGHWLVHD